MKKNFGMWIFLATEALIFGTMIFLYQIMYYRYRDEFHLAGHHLHFLLGTLNTVFLLTSSALVAWAIERKKRLGFFLAIILGVAFIFIKGHEYYSLTEDGKFPLHFVNVPHHQQLFLSFYGYITFLHLIHLLIGIFCLLFLLISYKKRTGYDRMEENIGLYWHFVDIVWVFLYPLFYLVGHQ